MPFYLALKVPITTAADDTFFDLFPNFLKKNKVIIPYLLFLKKRQRMCNVSVLQMAHFYSKKSIVYNPPKILPNDT